MREAGSTIVSPVGDVLNEWNWILENYPKNSADRKPWDGYRLFHPDFHFYASDFVLLQSRLTRSYWCHRHVCAAVPHPRSRSRVAGHVTRPPQTQTPSAGCMSASLAEKQMSPPALCHPDLTEGLRTKDLKSPHGGLWLQGGLGGVVSVFTALGASQAQVGGQENAGRG